MPSNLRPDWQRCRRCASGSWSIGTHPLAGIAIRCAKCDAPAVFVIDIKLSTEAIFPPLPKEITRKDTEPIQVFPQAED